MYSDASVGATVGGGTGVFSGAVGTGVGGATVGTIGLVFSGVGGAVVGGAWVGVWSGATGVSVRVGVRMMGVVAGVLVFIWMISPGSKVEEGVSDGLGL